MQLYELLGFFSSALLFLVTFFYGFYLSGKPSWLKFFFVYLFFLSLQDLISKYLWFHGQNNLIVLHVYNYFEWAGISLFYRRLNRSGGLFLSVGVLASLFLLITGSLFLYKLNEFQTLGFFGLKLFILTMSIREITLQQLEGKSRCIWINAGLILSSSVSLLIFSFGNLLIGVEKELQTKLWIFNSIVFIVSLALYSYELLPKSKWNLKT